MLSLSATGVDNKVDDEVVSSKSWWPPAMADRKPGLDFWRARPTNSQSVKPMNEMSAHCRWTLALVTAASLAACSGDKPVVKPQPQPTAEPAPTSTGEPGAGGAGGEVAKPASTAAPTAAPTTEPPRKARPASIFSSKKGISSTFGSTPGAVLKLTVKGNTVARFKIQEFALSGGTNITFEFATGVRLKKARALGKVIHMSTQIAGRKRFKKIATNGPAFELYLSLHGQESVNLAVGELELGPQGGETNKVSNWLIYAPTRVDKGLDQAYFELKEIGPSYLYATKAAPTVTTETPAAP